MMETVKKPYFKITFEDIEIAEDFFENDKHLAEFMLAVSCYYREKNFTIKTKIVQKYFNSYKKTMDFIIKSKQNGLKGGLQRTENKQLINSTLDGVVKVPPEPPLRTNIINNNKINSNSKREKESNNHYKQDNIPTEDDVVAFFSDNKLCTSQARKFFKKLYVSNFRDKEGKPIENWKAYALSLPDKVLTGGKTAEQLRLDQIRRLRKIPLEERLQN